MPPRWITSCPRRGPRGNAYDTVDKVRGRTVAVCERAAERNFWGKVALRGTSEANPPVCPGSPPMDRRLDRDGSTARDVRHRAGVPSRGRGRSATVWCSCSATTPRPHTDPVPRRLPTHPGGLAPGGQLTAESAFKATSSGGSARTVIPPSAIFTTRAREIGASPTVHRRYPRWSGFVHLDSTRLSSQCCCWTCISTGPARSANT